MLLDKFDRADETPIDWYNHANNLRAAAAAVYYSFSDRPVGDAIVEKFELGYGFSMAAAVPVVYEMLCGLSFELLLKAIASSMHQNIPTHHRLRDLAMSVSADLSSSDLGALDVLTHSVRWSGRYPRPSNRKDWDAARAMRERYLYKDVPLGGTAIKEYNGVLEWDRLSEIWASLVSQYWLLQPSM